MRGPKQGRLALACVLALGCGGEDAELTASLDAGSVDERGRGTPDASRGARDGGDAPMDVDGGTAPVPEAGPPSSEILVDVPGSFLLDDLTDVQYRAKCLDMQAGIAAVAKRVGIAVCTSAGLMAGQRQGTCDEVRDSCLRDDETSSFALDDLFDCSPRDTSDADACPGATVAEFDACADSYRARADGFASFSCRNTSREVEQAVAEAGTISPQCQAFFDKCP